MKVGILHPGDMGSSVGGNLVTAGHRVFWVAQGRSQATAQRAERDGMEALETLGELSAEVDIMLSICPPHGAVELATSVMETGFSGIFVDANAVAPDTVRLIASRVGAGVDFVDGGIVGPPARRAGSTRLYLCGGRAQEVAALFGGTLLQAHCIEGDPGAASALKMCYAAWTKGSAALLIAIAALARREGVDSALLEEWHLSQPDIPRQLQGALRSSTAKAWRFQGEMQEIAATFHGQAMPDGFHLAAAEIFRRLSGVADEYQEDDEAILQLLTAD